MINYIINDVNKSKIWTNNVGLSRSLIAFALMMTVLFNDNSYLFDKEIINKLNFDVINLYTYFEPSVVKIITILILLMVISGYYPRFTALLHWLVTYSFSSTSVVVDGGDQIASIMTFLLIPILLTDSRKNHWLKKQENISFNRKIVPYFFFFLIQLQASFIYFHAAVGKFKVLEWLNGTAVYYWLNNNLFGVNDSFLPYVNLFLTNPFIVVTITWGVLVLELLLSSMLFISNLRFKLVFMILGIIFHFLILLAHGLVSFFLIMSATLILYVPAKYFDYDKLKTIIRSRLSIDY